jgi:hypothetical protein
MTDGFGRSWSAGAVAGPVVAALLAGAAAYAVQQDSFAATGSPGPATADQPPQKDQALVALQKAVSKQQRQLDHMRTDLRRTTTAIKRTSRQAQAVAAQSGGSSWTAGSSATSGWTSSGTTGGGGGGSAATSGGGGSGGTGGGATATTTQPSTQGTTGASGAP